MTQSQPGRRYGAVAIALHWLIAAAILFQVALAWRMEGLKGPQGFALIQLHKSVGITILAASLLRLGWRLAHRPPPLVGLTAWEHGLARLTHLGFYAVMIGMPLTGWLAVSASRLRIPTLLYGRVPWPDIPGLAGLAEPARAIWRTAGGVGHQTLAWGFYGLFALHVAGALKHQLLDRDSAVLGRMAPGARPGRWLEPRLAAIGLGGAAAIWAGSTLRPPTPGVPPPPPVVLEPSAPAVAAAPAAPATPAPPPATTPAEPVRWVVAPGSTLGFETAWSDTAVQGRFGRWTAEISFSPEALDRSRVVVSVDMASAETGDAQRDAALAAPDWFDVGAHPRATFTATRFEHAGGDRYVAHGRLALRGASRPLSLPFRLQIDGDKARVRGVTSLDRTAFGVGQGEWTSTDQIPAKVTLSVDLRARRR